MSEENLSLEERVERYLSVEWAVTESTASGVTRFTKALVTALRDITHAMDAAHKEGDVQALSTGLTALLTLLSTCSAEVEQAEMASCGHYIELLGSREAVVEMSTGLAAYFFDEPEGEREANGFDELLASLGGDAPVQ